MSQEYSTPNAFQNPASLATFVCAADITLLYCGKLQRGVKITAVPLWWTGLVFPSCEGSVQISHVLQLFHGFDSPAVPLMKPPLPPPAISDQQLFGSQFTHFLWRLGLPGILLPACEGRGRVVRRGAGCCSLLQTPAKRISMVCN